MEFKEMAAAQQAAKQGNADEQRLNRFLEHDVVSMVIPANRINCLFNCL